jgi:hypothetical protein
MSTSSQRWQTDGPLKISRIEKKVTFIDKVKENVQTKKTKKASTASIRDEDNFAICIRDFTP